MSAWLVPVWRHLRFVQASGRTLENAFGKLQDAALGGRLGSVVCEVRGPLVDVAAGDQMWFYTDDLDAGVFAFGKAQRPTKTKKPTVTVTLDKARTRVLAADPLPAVTMRRWLPELHQGAVSLDLRPRALTVLEGWHRERAERDTEMLGVLGVTTWRATIRATGARQPARDDVLGPLARLLRSQDFAVGVFDGEGTEPWLVARRVRDVVAIDVERARGARARTDALSAFGPLREFKWRIERESVRELRLRGSLWMAFVNKPHDDVIAFLEDEDVLISWQQRNGAVELTDRSKQRWYQYLGVR
ncbi:MAG: hypothetical protein WD598_02635 [Acidimicrobiia bacterium]